LIKLAHEESTISTNDDSLALRAAWHGAEDGLNKVLGVVFLLEHLDLLPQTRSTWLLARVGFRGDGFDFVRPDGRVPNIVARVVVFEMG
jgi:hypothetical protein